MASHGFAWKIHNSQGDKMNLIQCRMARAALGWTSTRLAREAGILSNILVRYLNGKNSAPADVRRMRTAFVDAGITFIEGDHGPGVCLLMGEEIETATQATDVVELINKAANTRKGQRVALQALR